MISGSLRRTLSTYGFILPWLIALGVFIGFPFLAGLYFSFCDFPPLREPVFIGLDNYTELAGDPLFWKSMGVTLGYAAVGIPLGVVLALTLAMFLNARIRGQSLYRVIFYIPQLVPTVVVAILWMWIFNPKYGLLNIVLARVIGGLDAFAGLFFDLAAISTHEPFAVAGGVVLACVFAAAVCVLVAARRRGRAGAGGAGAGDMRRRRAWLTAVAAIAIVLAAVPSVYAALHYLMPVDMQKLHSPGWLTDANPMPASVPFAPAWALWALVVMSMWGVGQMAVIYLAKLQDVPVELYEAAEIDGATWLQKVRYVTIPMISPVILFNVVMAIIGTFQVFTEPYIMTGGGPEDTTRFAAMFVYDQAFQYQRVGYASAVAWVLFLVIVVLTILAFRVFQKRIHYAGR